METIIETGAGDDRITVGFVPTIPDRGHADLNNLSGIPIADTKHMSNGNSAVMYVYGGRGDDNFEVNHNVAELFLFGQENDDVFVINTFLVLSDNPDDPGSITNLSRLFGGSGSNRYEYLQNAPVHIFGGLGTDTVVINGTPIADTFVVTETYAAGAGRMTFFTGIEKLEINAAGGDDQIYVLGVPAHLEITVRGGTGDDQIHLGGDHPTLFFDPPPFTYQPPSFTVRDDPYIEFDVLQYDVQRFHKHLSFWGDRGLWNQLHRDSAGVVDFLTREVTGWVNRWYSANKDRFRYLDVRYPGGLDGLIAAAAATIQWKFSWGRWWIFDPYVDFSFDIPPVNVEYGYEVLPPPRLVTPPAITLDPNPFALKVDAVHTLQGIQGLVTIDGGEDGLGDQDALIVHDGDDAAGRHGSLVNATYLRFSSTDAANPDPPAAVLTTPRNTNLTATARGSKAEIRLPNTIRTGDTWTVAVGGANYTYQAGSNGDPLTSEAVAQGLAAKIQAAGQGYSASATTYLNLTGLGLRAGSVNGVQFDGSWFENIEHLDLRLGRGSDQFVLDAAATDGETLPVRLVLGEGDDTVTVKSITGPTDILGGRGSDQVRLENDRQTTDAIVDHLHFDAGGEIVEQSAGIAYHPATHDPIIAGVPFVFTHTGGGTLADPRPQFKEEILRADRTAHISVLGRPAVSDLSPSITRLANSIAQYWTAAEVALEGSVRADDLWVLNLNGIDYTYRANPADGLNLGRVAQGLKNAVGSAYDVGLTADGTGLRLRDHNGAPFTVQILKGLDKAGAITGTVFDQLVQFELQGPVIAGAPWFITLGSSVYTYTATAQDTLQRIAAQLAAKIDNDPRFAARTNQYLDIYVVDFDPLTGKPIQDTVQRRGVQERGYLETGFQLQGYAVRGYQETDAHGDPLYLDPNNLKTTDDTGVPSIIIDNQNTSGRAGLLYEDVLGNLTTVNSGKQVIIIDQANASHLAGGLFISGNGSLTTSDTGIQALQIMQQYRTVVPLYRDPATDAITTRFGADLVTAVVPAPATQVRPLQFDENGNKAPVLPLSERGYQARGYQQYGYFQHNTDSSKSTTNIGADYHLVQKFDDGFAVPLYSRIDSAGNLQITTENIAGSRPLIKRSFQIASAPLYLDANGNLTTQASGNQSDWRRDFQRKDAAGNPLYLTVGNTLTTDAAEAYRQAVIVTNQLLYLDDEGHPTLDPTGNRQWIRYDARGTKVTLYADADLNPTTRIKNPSVVVVDDPAAAPLDILGAPVTIRTLYLDEAGNKTTAPTPNKSFGATDSNATPLVYSDHQALDTETADPLPVPRVQDNGQEPGTARYDRPRFTKATIEVDRLKLIAGTRPFEVCQSPLDTGSDTYFIDHSGSDAPVVAILNYDGGSDTHILAGLLPGAEMLTGSGLENIEVHLGSPADTFTINSTRAAATIHTAGGQDTVNIVTADGETHIFSGADADFIRVKAVGAPVVIHGGGADDIIDVGNDGRRLADIAADLTLHGDGGSDTINLDNAGAASGTPGALTGSRLSGLDMGGRIDYFSAEVLNLDLGSGPDDFSIESTHAGLTRIDAGSGANRIQVRTIAGFTDIQTGSQADTVTVGDHDRTLAGIRAILNLDAGLSAADTLIVDNSGAPVGQTGRLFEQQVIGFGMRGRLDFTAFENVALTLGDLADTLTVDATIDGTTDIDTGGGDDRVKIETFDGRVHLATGGGSDTITLFDGEGDAVGPGALLEIDGGPDGDTYHVSVARAGLGAGFVNLNDTGVVGMDELIYRGSSGNDLLQLDTVYRRSQDPAAEFSDERWVGYGSHGEGVLVSHFNSNADDYQAKDIDNPDALLDVATANLSRGDDFHVLNYSTIEEVTVLAGAGADKIISDDTAQQFNVYGNEGDDQFFVGSLLETETVLVEGREATVVKQITHGTSFNMSFYGGADDDYFEVNHNVADISLFGDNGDDTFFIKALLTLDEDEELVEIDNQVAHVSAVTGEGSEDSQKNNDTRQVDLDALVYVENANINIDGGAGFDSVAVVGTVLSDTFYLFNEVENGRRVQRIFGAGVKLRELLNIERIQLITGAGDDRIFVYGVDLGPVADMVINTGTGSDTVVLGGPALTIDLSFPQRSRTEYASVAGFEQSGEFDVAFGLDIEFIDALTRVVPVQVEEPAHTRTRQVAAVQDLGSIRSPLTIRGLEGFNDRIVFNNHAGPQELVFSDRTLVKKQITTDAQRVRYSTAGPAGDGLTDLIARLNELPAADRGTIRQTVNDYLVNQITFSDRYFDHGLIDRLQALQGARTETVTIPAGISYVVFQDKLDENQNIVTARFQLEAFLAGTGYAVQYKTTPHPDPSKPELLYDIDQISDANGNHLAYQAQYREIVKDGQAFRDVIGVSLVTAAALDVDLQSDYLTSFEVLAAEDLNTLMAAGATPMVYFDGFDEVDIQLSRTQAGTLTLENDLFTGKTLVRGGDRGDTFQVDQIAGQTFLQGGGG